MTLESPVQEREEGGGGVVTRVTAILWLVTDGRHIPRSSDILLRDSDGVAGIMARVLLCL